MTKINQPIQESVDMLPNVDQGSKKIIADAIFKTISKPVVTVSMMKLWHLFLTDDTIGQLMSVMEQLSVITRLPNGDYRVNPRDLKDLIPPVSWLLVTEGRYKPEEIEEKLKSLPPLDKQKVSGILTSEKSPYTWIDVNETPAPIDKPVAIRFVDPNKTYGETFDVILEAEDMKIATIDEKGNWKILPPFPLFDYSPLSNKENIDKGCTVTHWAEVSDEEMNGWNTRFNPLGRYKLLNIEADKDHQELVYKSLLWASHFIKNAIENNANPESVPELTKYYATLADLQYCMDSGKPLSNMEESDT